MQQARYSPENVGHFGLAAQYYTHFTSPIRRYPDLIVHRSLKRLLWQDDKKKAPSAKLQEAGEFLSKRERVAVDAEREMFDRLKVRYLENKIGETFSGIISGITSFGLFIELTKTMISGAVSMGDLPRGGYEFHEKRHTLIGRLTGKSYQVGDLVTVRLLSVDKRARRINFTIAEDEQETGSEQ
jgi:ribonuclease R